MQNRTEAVEQYFFQSLEQAVSHQADAHVALSYVAAWEIFDSQLTSRLLDYKARMLKAAGLGFYTIGSSGHEGNALLAHCARLDDMAFLHYRSGGFYIQRAKYLPEINPIEDILHSLMASKNDPISGGRHKVFGRHALNIPPQTSTIASHCPKAVGAAMSIGRAKALRIVGNLPQESVVICSVGDASMNHASCQSALNSASHLIHAGHPLPLVFVCEDNGLGISVPTSDDWIYVQNHQRPGWHYIAANSWDIEACFSACENALAIARGQRRPVLLHLKMQRLLGHAGSDIESQYLTKADFDKQLACDPVVASAKYLRSVHGVSVEKIKAHYHALEANIHTTAATVLPTVHLKTATDVMAALVPAPVASAPYREHSGDPEAHKYAKLMNQVLAEGLDNYPHMLVFGEDVGKKGGVYRVTADLQAKFGPKRVFDTLLDETAILGTAIGLAHNGFLPVPEIQFLAYLHNAEDQLRGEAASLSYFSNGQYSNPMIIRLPSLAYQKGFGGHFHNDNSLSVLLDIPELIICCPSNGESAVKCFRQCLYLANVQKRIIAFIEPIAMYAYKDLHSYPSGQTALGEVSYHGDGPLLVITYGNGVALAKQAQAIVANENIQLKILDLNWLAPLPEDDIVASIADSERVIIMDECRESGAVSHRISTLILKHQLTDKPIDYYFAKDCYIPLGPAAQTLLPSTDGLITLIKKGTMPGTVFSR